MKRFNKWLTEMDAQQPPPHNGGITPSIPPEVAQELSQMAQQVKELHEKMQEMLSKLGMDHQKDDKEGGGMQQKGPKPLGMESGMPKDNAALQMNSGPQ
jgi:hypothetical protein